jgi:hypothetical protein
MSKTRACTVLLVHVDAALGVVLVAVRGVTRWADVGFRVGGAEPFGTQISVWSAVEHASSTSFGGQPAPTMVLGPSSSSHALLHASP